ncbi:hypothetical protein F4823DRAFT_565872 [Ustulina deusta]|nr:hypothetical protein F4823DRAFT_565872 [Ustulina deusta]
MRRHQSHSHGGTAGYSAVLAENVPIRGDASYTISWVSDGTAARIYFALNALRMLREPVFGTYTGLYAGLSPDLKIEHNGTDVTPRGMRRPDSEITRKDIPEATA